MSLGNSRIKRREQCDLGCLYSRNPFVICRCMVKRERAQRCYLQVRHMLHKRGKDAPPHVNRLTCDSYIRIFCKTLAQFTGTAHMIDNIIDLGYIQRISFPMDWNLHNVSIGFFFEATPGKLYVLHQFVLEHPLQLNVKVTTAHIFSL